MIWLPLCLLLAILALAEARGLVAASSERGGFALAAAFVISALWLLGAIFLTVDLLALADGVTRGLAAFNDTHARMVTALLAVAGLGLAFGGMGRAAGRWVEADPQGPVISLAAPVLAAGAGLALVLAALLRG